MMEPASWLARARAQSQNLADARTQKTKPWRPPVRERRPHHRALAAALLLLLASGAWAVVARTDKPPAPPSPPAPAAPPPPAKAAVLQVAPAPPAPLKKMRKKRAPLPPTFEEGDGEIIIVAPHEAQPPLFSPEEWKKGK
jgi:hypothetical protein